MSYIIILAILTAFSAYFSATETAFSSLNRTRLRLLAEKGDKKAESALKLAEDYDRLISTILIGNNIVNIACASIGTVMFTKIFTSDPELGATVSTVVITVILLIFGEISPKSIAKDRPERFAIFSAPIIRLFIYLLLPLNIIFSLWKALLSKLLKLDDEEAMSQEELRMLVEEVQQEGNLDEDEGELLVNAIEFNSIEAEDILTHRVDLEAVSVDADKSEIARVFSTTKYSRILVYGESIDNIIGVIHLKDFYTGMGVTEKPVEEIISPVIFVLKTEKINDMLQKLQKSKSHLAVVLDEYGGTYGIVTMEDILEELVGDIWDEHDEVVEVLQRTGEDTYTASGQMDLDDFCETFSVKPESESTTLGGWVSEVLEKVPEVGEGFDFGNLTLTVTELDNHRVQSVKILCNDTEAAENEE